MQEEERLKSFSLFELVSSVRRCIESSFNKKYWIRAESSDVRTAGGSGHCYLELLEKDEAHNVKARVRANIWRQSYLTISERLKAAGLPPLASDMSLLCLVQVQYHEQYGLSLLIHDIDPSYSLGEIARRRQETIQRLKREGVYDANKGIDLPRPLHKLAIISSPTAAGFGDFMNQLMGNAYGFKFYTALYTAQMQGDRTTESVIAALERVAKNLDKFDAVVIIRGGGATSELRAFDDYDLCYYCTQFPLPIISGIGHERDVSVLDMVANTSLKTPTAVAEFLIHGMLREYNEVELRRERLMSDVALKQTEWHRKLDEQCLKLPNVAGRLLQREQLRQANLRQRLVMASKGVLDRERRLVERVSTILPLHLRSCLQRERQTLEQSIQRLKIPVRQHQARYETELSAREQSLRLAHPDNILKRGFAVVRQSGKLITSGASIASGDKLEIQLGKSKLSVTAD